MNQIAVPPDSRKPNWTKWRLIPEVRVWQAVALSLDIDPDLVRRSRDSWMVGKPVFLEDREFKDRVDIACANVRSVSGASVSATNLVSLRDFVSWLVSIDLSIPEELRALAGTNTTRALQAPLDAPTPEASSERTNDPLKAGTVMSAKMTAADEFFRQWNAEAAAQVPKLAHETGYAQLIAEVDAKDLKLNLAPDWPHWTNMAYVTVSDAACLSLGISPEAKLPQINLSVVRERAQAANADLKRIQLGVAALERAQRLIQQRVEQAMSAIKAGRLPISGPPNINQVLGFESPPSMVELPRYRRWAESLPEPYVFPEGFPPVEPNSELAAHSSAQPEALATDDEKPLREPERGNWLAIIHALAEMAELPERGAASSVEAQLQRLGYERPKERTIRDVLNEARKSKD